jgi:uncharacterized protein (TIGR02588 family)
MSETRRKTTNAKEDGATPLLEWIAGAVGVVLFAGALAVLAYEGISPKTPPAIEARVVETREQPGGWLVAFEAENSGDEPAEVVTFIVTLGGGKGSAVAEREVTIDFIGPHSVRRAGIFFATDPTGRDILIEPQGYLEP